MKKKNQKEYRRGKIGLMVHVLAGTFKLDEMLVRATLAANFPELKDKKFCANCGESMAEYVYGVSMLDADLLCEMAKIVNARMARGLPFTEANKIHLHSEIKSHTLISRQTISSKLGLIAKVMKDGKHDRRQGWCITKRGFDFIAGKAVPRQVVVFRNEIRERLEGTVTMTELYANEKGKAAIWNQVAQVFVDGYSRPRLL